MMTDPPLSPPPEPMPASAHRFEFNRPTVVSLLFIASFLTLLTAMLAGLILAYVWRNEPHEAWEQSHFTYMIRTFWIGLLGSVISAVLSLVLIGLLGFVLIGVWVVVRSVMSLVAAQQHAPIRHPLKLLW
jgi:uncharacterized membrane protein